ncbi:MAG: fasciclin domain-containing protein [Candidatus Poseidoniaceae archaeon]
MNKTAVYLVLTLLLASAMPLSVHADQSKDIPTNASETGVHNSLVAALQHANLVATLGGPGPFTVFAPTDQAFTDAGINLNDFDTPEENQTLTEILLHHVVSGSVPSADVKDGMMATTVNGDKVKFTVSNGAVSVGAAQVTTPDVLSSNGIIHVIDKVLMPPVDIPATAQTTGIHNSLVAAVIQADLLPTLQGPGPFTVFAPTDQAFTDAGIDLASLDTPTGKQQLSDILLYHVVSAEVPAKNVSDCMLADAANGQQLSFSVGDSVMVNDANVTLTDVITSNGLIHVIDKVLMPTDSPRDIPRTAQCTGIHDSLVAGVIQAELLSTLQGPGPFTVFAPTDQAFIDAGIDLASLDTPEGKATLSDILLYHVVAGEVPAANVSECMSADAVNGQPLAFTVDGGVMVNDANVTLPDVMTSNGIIHVIDKVLMPSDAPNDIPRTAQCTGIHDSLVAAVIQAELLETLQGQGPFTVFAPTDQAFTNAGIDLASLDTPEGKAILSDILLYHVVAGNVPSSAVTECMSADAVNGQPLSFTVNGGVMVNDANVSLPDVATSNGVIHVIDKVLMPTDTPNDIPRTAQCTGQHNSLVSSVIQAELLETLQGDGPFTVFAPTDQAFTDAGIDLANLDNPEGKAALADILLYHVLDGEVPAANVTDCLSATTINGNPLSFTVGDTVMVNGATVTATDVPTSNGIIHVIDKVLLPTDTPNDIPRTAQCTGIHDSLVAAVVQAELLETLQGEGPFTVFAPTDQAFADAGIDLAALDNEEGKAALTDILLYHVVGSEVPSSAVEECGTATAVNGDTLSFGVGDTVTVNGATVTLPDVATSNGVIHVIDKVLMPTDTPNDIPRTAQCTGIHDSLVAAVIQAELLETLQGDGPFTIFAPTDQAFADAGIDLASLDTPEGKAILSDILLYHVVAGEVPSSAVNDCTSTDAVNGQPLAFTVGDSVMVNDATVTLPDIATSNGIIHVIDTVLTPSDAPNDATRTAICTGVHTSLVAALIQAELVETLQGEGPFTIFAPTDQAFADAGIDLSVYDTPEGKAQLSDILLYHVHAGTVLSSDLTEGMTLPMVNGKNATISLVTGIDGANITTADVVTSNGVIHVIDKVIIPQAEVDPTATGDGVEADEEDDDNLVLILSIIGAVVLLGAIGGLLFVRGRRPSPGVETKDFAQDGLSTVAQPATTYSYEPQQAAQQTYTSQYAPQQSSPFQPVQVEQAQPVQAAAQPVAQVQAAQPAQAVAQTQASQAAVQLPEVLQQWTDDSGYTWRRMSDGSTMWWNGTDWQKYA